MHRIITNSKLVNVLNLTNIGETLTLNNRILEKGNTEGRQFFVNDVEKAYIAGFLDGDGSIMAQLISRKGYRLGFQIRVSIVFYQKMNHRDYLIWLKSRLKHGYIRDRNDGMSEYTIVGLKEVESVLTLLLPFLRLKKDVAIGVLKIIRQHPPARKMTAGKLLRLAKLVDETAKFNYSKRRTVTYNVVKSFLDNKQKNVPVETSS